jgi:hypothetical protein
VGAAAAAASRCLELGSSLVNVEEAEGGVTVVDEDEDKDEDKEAVAVLAASSPAVVLSPAASSCDLCCQAMATGMRPKRTKSP